MLPGDPERLDPDGDGTACEQHNYTPDPVPARPTVQAPADDEGDSAGSRNRSGNSGHPCLPGERDGDGDGYCGEG